MTTHTVWFFICNTPTFYIWEILINKPFGVMNTGVLSHKCPRSSTVTQTTHKKLLDVFL